MWLFSNSLTLSLYLTAYQISITSAGLQWKHPEDYNLNHDDQGTMLIEDPSAHNENVTRCLKPYNMRIMKQEFFRAFKCAKHGDWALLFRPYNDRGEPSIFEVYPPEDDWEEEMRYEIEHVDNDWEYEQYHDSAKSSSYHHDHGTQYVAKQKKSARKGGSSGSGHGQHYGTTPKKSAKGKKQKSGGQQAHSNGNSKKYKVKQRN